MLSRLRGLVQNRPKDRPQMPTSGQALLWDDLHDYALLETLDHLSITDLVRLEAVNRRLHHLVRRTLNGRHHLLLIIGYQYGEYEQYQKDVIILSSWSVDTVEQILRLLPNLTSLWFVITIEIKDEIEIQPLTLLLGRLSTQLTVLRLDFKEAQLPPNLSLSPLIPIINRMVHLRNFNCYFDRLFTPEEPPLLQLPVIRHLEVFNCTIWECGDLLLAEVLTQMAATTQDTPPLVYLPASLMDPASIGRLLNTTPQIAQCFRSLGLHTLDELTATQLNVICERFCNLEHLNMASPLLTTRQLATALVKLPQLTSLTWFIHFPLRQSYRENPFFYEEELEPDEMVEEEALPQLTTVESVNLIWHIVRHEDLALLHLKRLFPSVTSLDIWIRSCDQCGILTEDEEGTKRRKRCLMKTATYWRDLPKLEEVTSLEMDITEAEWRSMEGVRGGRLCDSRLCKAFKGIYKKLSSWIGGCCDGRRHH